MIFLLPFLTAEPSQDLLQKIEENLYPAQKEMSIRFVVHKKKRSKDYTLTLRQKDQQSSVVFHTPARDRGTKYLREKNGIWMYIPSLENVEKITGHMLQQGIMGSELSYEDLMNQNNPLSKDYKIISRTEGKDHTQECIQISLKARFDHIPYAQKEMCVHPKYYIPLYEKWFSPTGILLKEWIRTEIKIIDNIPTPHKIEIRDSLHTNRKTVIHINMISYTNHIKDDFFSRRWLER